jgi:hypothetical protein
MQVTENQPISPSKDLVGRPVEVRVLFRAPPLYNQRVTADKAASVDMPINGMNEAGDKLATNAGNAF